MRLKLLSKKNFTIFIKCGKNTLQMLNIKHNNIIYILAIGWFKIVLAKSTILRLI